MAHGAAYRLTVHHVSTENSFVTDLRQIDAREFEP